MLLVKWAPMNDLARLCDEMETHGFLGRTPEENLAGVGETWSPAVDIYEEAGNLVIKADPPGVRRHDVDITASEDNVTIEAHTQDDNEAKREGYYHRERHSGRFLRTLLLPDAVDAAKAQAIFKNGTLTITLPKGSGPSKGKALIIQ